MVQIIILTIILLLKSIDSIKFNKIRLGSHFQIFILLKMRIHFHILMEHILNKHIHNNILHKTKHLRKIQLPKPILFAISPWQLLLPPHIMIVKPQKVRLTDLQKLYLLLWGIAIGECRTDHWLGLMEAVVVVIVKIDVLFIAVECLHHLGTCVLRCALEIR